MKYCLALIVLLVVCFTGIAQAQPHFYKNGVMTDPGFVGWGTLETTNYQLHFTCPTEVAGTINEDGISAKITGFSQYSCVSEYCESHGSQALSNTSSISNGGIWEVSLQSNNRLKIGNLNPLSETKIDFTQSCKNSSIFHLTGELKPEWINGSMIGSAPSRVRFNGTEEEGFLSNTTSVIGTMKIMGEEAEELITEK